MDSKKQVLLLLLLRSAARDLIATRANTKEAERMYYIHVDSARWAEKYQNELTAANLALASASAYYGAAEEIVYLLWPDIDLPAITQ